MSKIVTWEPVEFKPRSVRMGPDTLSRPLLTKEPTTFAVKASSDVFAVEIDDDHVAAVFGVIASCPQHTFHIVTDNGPRLREWFSWVAAKADPFRWMVGSTDVSAEAEVCLRALSKRQPILNTVAAWPLRNLHLGVRVQVTEHIERVRNLRCVPAAGRFVVVEPIEAIDTKDFDLGGMARVYVGGEKDPGAQPCDVQWIRSILAFCKDEGVPCVVTRLGSKVCDASLDEDKDWTKEWPTGTRVTSSIPRALILKDPDGADPGEWPADLAEYAINKVTCKARSPHPLTIPVDYDALDPGIRNTVALLRTWGFATTDSGDGKTKIQAGITDGVIPTPHVAIRVSPAELIEQSNRLRDLLWRLSVPVEPQGPDPAIPHIEASYDPANTSAMIILLGVDDTMLAAAQKRSRRS